ncbi:hypothetical protein EMIHUDRAFT_455799 [Emiliania huxleyi CCMP1516]|uniref:Prolyl 4-hydroxylase alpha subunit domain-containing protein n=2 Tax=Emiliania huxleyi TaxID=2903 RepID=A0A0D3KCM3_EMIH1|nr:hypothetical protein EMIHUDRAFT_455799 [Emiliania huxleyi CCMP1516]EOD33508.1 hypothetical protein EMIHUDRAFT_455799 [Emiliania huxleyi CCMP1516]|eukprot:XP_005785937.1 hypothetical protein EMIHUDRAFT_455799 [Emiliania huxleyi CCMP1516]
MGKKKAEPDRPKQPRAPFVSSRQWRRFRKCTLWLLVPISAALALTFFGPPPPPEADATRPYEARSSGFVRPPEPQDLGPPDSWLNPAECLAWAGSGQCKSNPGFMLINCNHSCAKLDLGKRQYAARCPTPANHTAALPPGVMHATFERVMSEFAELQPERISVDPPVILFHKFFSEEETEAFIRHGRGRYAKRVADITQTPTTNAEFAQLVYYHACAREGEPDCAFYRRHNDYIDGSCPTGSRDQNSAVDAGGESCYMNDVPGGGATTFPNLPSGPVTFLPQRGKAVLWPSALPVTKGEKFGANFWIHQYDFKTPYAKGCTAS